MKLLLYCTKAKPYLVKVDANEFDITNDSYDHRILWDKKPILNGKIVAECDFEAIKIEMLGDEMNIYYGVERESCLTTEQIEFYFGYNNDYKGYAIHIKNLHIFDKPKELSDYFIEKSYNDINKIFTDEIQSNGSEWIRPIKKAPQNMMYAYDTKGNKYVVISIQPQWLCKILNREKTIEVRKKVLKEMLIYD